MGVGTCVVASLAAGVLPAAGLDLARPLTVGNFEGIAALPGKSGRLRFYLISDDNASSRQRTLLLAFDWPPTETVPPPPGG
ncbi:MAG TPA: hypothetical protein VNI57_06620 [Candidatus Saccharimonadales bacterium]|nr:hypothetical protein [Candidatus Saccharimonadales bacterium]